MFEGVEKWWQRVLLVAFMVAVTLGSVWATGVLVSMSGR